MHTRRLKCGRCGAFKTVYNLTRSLSYYPKCDSCGAVNNWIRRPDLIPEGEPAPFTGEPVVRERSGK